MYSVNINQGLYVYGERIYTEQNTVSLIETMIINKAYQLGSTFASQRKDVVAFVPLSEWCSVNNNNGVLHQSLGTYQFVVTGIVHNIDNTSFAGAAFRTPGEVTCVQTQSTVFGVTTTCSYTVDTLRAKL